MEVCRGRSVIYAADAGLFPGLGRTAMFNDEHKLILSSDILIKTN